MIDAASFAGVYNAFWQTHTPMCEHFVRRLNIEELERFEMPMAVSKTTNRSYIAEYAFSMFVEKISDLLSSDCRNAEDLHLASKRQTDKRLLPYVEQGLMLLDKFSIEEHNEIIAITESLLKFFSDKKEGLVLRPTFLGCGFVDASEGDIIAQKTIFEIKTVDRKLRSKDIRQLITYAALNNASNKFPIDRVGLVNPRKGLYFSLSVDEVCSRISGASAAALLPVIIDALSSGSISR